MSVGFLVGAVLIAASALLALRPPRRPRAVARLGYVVGLGLNEAPQLWLVLLTISTVLEVGAGGPVRTSFDWAALTVVVVAVLVLLGLSYRALGASSAVAEGLREAGLAVQSLDRRRTVSTLLRPFPVRPRRIRRIADIGYGGGRRRRLDVYRRRSGVTSAPVLVYFHGGGYVSGGKHREARLLLHRFAEWGWVCVSAGYRLRPAASFPGHLVDAKAAIAWVREHAGHYGADPATLVVAGSSAGAHLASLVALTPNEAVLQPGFEDADTTVSAVVGLYGYYGRYCEAGDESPPSTPLAYDASSAPPFFLAHGDLDSMVPAASSSALADHLRESSSNPVVHVELPGAQHGFDILRSVRFDAVVTGVAAFLRGVGLGPVGPENATVRAPRSPRRAGIGGGGTAP